MNTVQYSRPIAAPCPTACASDSEAVCRTRIRQASAMTAGHAAGQQVDEVELGEGRRGDALVLHGPRELLTEELDWRLAAQQAFAHVRSPFVGREPGALVGGLMHETCKHS